RDRLAPGHRDRVDVVDGGLVRGEQDLLLVGREGRPRDRGGRQELLDRVLARGPRRQAGQRRSGGEDKDRRDSQWPPVPHWSLPSVWRGDSTGLNRKRSSGRGGRGSCGRGAARRRGRGRPSPSPGPTASGPRPSAGG